MTLVPYYKDDWSTIYHGDCREILPLIAADVLVTDPPYGIDFAGQPTKWQRRAGKQPEGWDRETVAEVPDMVGRFAEAFVWGGNYYALPPTRGWLCWMKPDAPPIDGVIRVVLDEPRRGIASRNAIDQRHEPRANRPSQPEAARCDDVDAQLRCARSRRGSVHGQRNDAARLQGPRTPGHRYRTRGKILRHRGQAACAADAVRSRPMTPGTFPMRQFERCVLLVGAAILVAFVTALWLVGSWTVVIGIGGFGVLLFSAALGGLRWDGAP